MSSGLLGRLRGRSKAPDVMASQPSSSTPSPRHSRQGSQHSDDTPSSARSRARSKGDDTSTTAKRRMSTSTGQRDSLESPQPQIRVPKGADPLAHLQREEDVRRERILNKAGSALQEVSTLYLTNALVITRREGLGLGQSKGDMWSMRHIAQAKKKSEEAVEFSDSDGDAVRFLLAGGNFHICVNGVVRGDPKHMKYNATEKTLRSKPWRIGLDKVKPEDLPLLLAHLGALFTKAGIVHNLPSDIPEDDDDPVAEIKRQMAVERENTGKIIDDIERHKEAEVTLRKEMADLHGLLGKRAEEVEAEAKKNSDAKVKNATLQTAVDQGVVKRRELENSLEEKTAECDVLKQESQHGRTGDKSEINSLTSRLTAALDEIGRYKLSLAEAELRATDLQSSLADAALRRQQAELALAEKEASLHDLNSSIAIQQQSNEHNVSTDIEELESARRATVESEEHAKREYITLWLNAERQIQTLKERHFELEKMSLEQLEATARQLLEAEERGRREYQGIWLRAELRNVANSTASQMERGAVLSLKERLAAEKEKLRRARNYIARSYPVPHATVLARCYRQMAFYALWQKFSRLANASASALSLQISERRTLGYFLKWRLWLSDHTHDRTLAIRAYMQERPLFYLDETIARMALEQEEQAALQELMLLSHLLFSERIARLEIDSSQHSHRCEIFALRVMGIPLHGSRESLNSQLGVVQGLLQLEEQKGDETEKAFAHIQRQRDEMQRHNELLRMEVSKIDVLRLLYAHLDGKRQIEVEHQTGIVNMLYAMLFPRRSVCADGGWVLSSLNDWNGGGTWSHRFIWLDITKGHLYISSKDPRLSGGPDVKCIRLANIVAVEVELFGDGLQPPPVSRYQQLGFYIELSKGGKHRFCAATVGERTEWLNSLRRSLLNVWKVSETPLTMVGGGGSVRGGSAAPSVGPASPPSPPQSASYRKHKKASVVVPPLPLPSPRSPRPSYPSESPPRRRPSAARHYVGHPATPERQVPGMPLEHLSYMGLP